MDLSRSPHSPQLQALSYFLVLFPSLDVCSGYPLGVHVIANNIYIVVIGQDSSKKAKHRFGRYDLFIQLGMRFFVALVPIVAALFISNLVYVLKYAGMMGFGICFLFPTLLQLQSQKVCKNLFGRSYYVETQENDLAGLKPDSTPLMSVQQKVNRDTSALYMTPYSSRLLSHPITVSILGVLGLLLFLLAVIGLFFHPDTVTCTVYEG